MTDVIAVIKDMQERFYREFGDLNGGKSQHEKHLTWMSGYYADLEGLPTPSDEDKPYFSQKYNNHTFVIGYRIGLKESHNAYNKGYEDGVEDTQRKLKVALGLKGDGQ